MERPLRLAPAPTLLERLRASQELRSGTLLAAARRVRRLTDEDAIHDLRVAARRLLAALGLWDRALPSHAWRTARRELRGLRRRAGRARELEVFAAALTERLPSLEDASRAPVLALLGRLEQRLARRRARLARRIRPKRLRRTLRGLPLNEEAIGPALVARARQHEREIEATAREAIASALEDPADGALHDARIAVKKWRYVSEALDEAGIEAGPRPLEALRSLQEVLGLAQDRATLRDEIERWVMPPDRAVEAEALRPLLDTLRNEHALAVTEFRRRAADLPAARTRRPRLRQAEPAAQSAWETTEKERLSRWLDEVGRGHGPGGSH